MPSRPGWTSYHRRLRYQTYDVTGLLRPGPNAIGFQVADGWWRGRLGFVPGARDTYGTSLGLLAQLEITSADGGRVVIGTDRTWRCATGPVLAADLYDGERHDAARELPGWSHPGFDDTGWGQCRPVELDVATLVAPDAPPVRATDGLTVRETIITPSGRTVLDFGQNLVAWPRIRAPRPPGRDGHHPPRRGARGRRARGAAAAHRAGHRQYTLRGDAGGEDWEPEFTLHGFRYAEVSGDQDELAGGRRRYHSDLARTGWFACSHDLLSRLHENVVWSMRGNFVDVPTDCPQRDERLGWTGDIQVFVPNRRLPVRHRGLPRRVAEDLAAEQTPDGTVPLFVPRVVPRAVPSGPPPPAGATSRCSCPGCYQCFGDDGLLRRQYPSMRAWVDGRVARAWHAVRPAGTSSATGSTRPRRPTRPRGGDRPDLVATRTVRTSRACSRGRRGARRGGRRRQYAELPASVRQAFHDEYVTPRGRIVSDTQTAYALALVFDLFPDPDQRAPRRPPRRAGARRRLHVATGFLGTPLICRRSRSRGRRRRRPTAADRRPSARRGSTRSRWAPRRSGSAGTACCPTGPSTRAR